MSDRPAPEVQHAVARDRLRLLEQGRGTVSLVTGAAVWPVALRAESVRDRGQRR